MGTRIARAIFGASATIALVAGVSSVSLAAGAGGGDFDCRMSGVPGWGTVTSTYYHPTAEHWATAIGRGRQTETRPAGTPAEAKIGRAFGGNKCLWGKK